MSYRGAPQLHQLEPLPTGGDAALVARAKGDPQAFGDLYQRYIDVVFRYCLHRLGSYHAAEDATSDIFVKAFTRIRSCRDEDRFRSWLFAIAHNVVTDNYRARHPDAPIDTAGQVHDRSNPEHEAIVAEGDRSVHALLGHLVPRQARIIELRLAGLTGPEIADVLGCSLAAVKIGQLRGYSRLREIVGDSRDGRDRHGER